MPVLPIDDIFTFDNILINRPILLNLLMQILLLPYKHSPTLVHLMHPTQIIIPIPKIHNLLKLIVFKVLI